MNTIISICMTATPVVLIAAVVIGGHKLLTVLLDDLFRGTDEEDETYDILYTDVRTLQDVEWEQF